MKNYKLIPDPIYYDQDSIDKLETYNSEYQKLSNLYISYNNYSKIVFEYVDTLDLQGRMKKLLIEMSSNYNNCLGEMLNNKKAKLTQQCVNGIDEDINKVNELISDVNKSKYQGAYQLRSPQLGNGEYLIFLKEENGKQIFMTYSEKFSDAIYSPGAVYEYDPNLQIIELLYSPEYYGLFAPHKPQIIFTLNKVGNVVREDKARISYSDIQYTTNVPSQEDQLGLSIPYSSTALNSILSDGL